MSGRLLYYRGNINPSHVLPALLCPVVTAIQSAVVLIEAANDGEAGRKGREGEGETMARGGGALMRRVNPPSEREKNTAMLLCVCLCVRVCASEAPLHYREGIQAIWILAEWTSGWRGKIE